MRPASEQSETDWSEVERKISDFAKKYSLIGIGILGLLLSFGLGGQFLAVLGGIAAMGAYFAYPKEIEQWLEKNQPMIAGAAFGFFYAGPMGLILGAWIGQFLHTKYEQITNAANQVARVVRPVIASGNWIKEKTGALYQNTLSGLKMAGGAIIGTGVPDEEESVEPEVSFTDIINSGRSLFSKGADFLNTQLSNVTNYLQTQHDAAPQVGASSDTPSEPLPLANAPVYLASQGPGAVAQANSAAPEPPLETPDATPSQKRKKRNPEWLFPLTIM